MIRIANDRVRRKNSRKGENGNSHHYREIPRRVETAVARESGFQVYGDQQVQDRVKYQH